MFTIKNLRKEKKGDWTYLVVDFDVKGIKNPFEEKTMWFAVKNQNADMLTDDVYDAFAPIALYLGMHFHQDVHIKGKISPKLYHSLTHYVMKIFDGFSKDTKFVKFTVDGFKIPKKSSVNLVGTGISCGVDSLTSIYDNFIQPTDKNLKVNSLFLVNCGTHGDFEDEKTRRIWLKRAELNRKAAEEMKLPIYLIDSNLHAFTHKVGENKMGYLAIYCCIMCVQKYVRRYLSPSSSSYDDNLKCALTERDVDMAGYCEIFLPHLFSTEIFELLIDGCQYTRSEKIEKIQDWDIAQKYLNVCLSPRDDASNCSMCQKCIRTLLVLETINKLEEFSGVFDLEPYRKHRNVMKAYFASSNDIQSVALTEYLRKHDVSMPIKPYANICWFAYRVVRKLNKIFKQQNIG